MAKGFIIAIDGPVASGKGTIAPLLAKKLNGFYMQTGAMYRSLALYCIENGINPEDPQSVIAAMPKADIKLEAEKTYLNGNDVIERIKAQDVGSGSSKVAAFSEVQFEIIRREQEMAKKMVESGKIIIAEGRNTGTGVFENADLKIFLTASVEVRAKRRMEQFISRGIKDASFEEVLADTKERDVRDSSRKTFPLVNEPEKYNYFVLDNSNLTERETLDIMFKRVIEKGLI